jgi:hypothetical protein
LREYADRFHPHFVVVSVCPNDFGEARSVLAGHGDWAEARYWLEEIRLFCRARTTPCLLVAAPFEYQVTAQRDEGNYPGRVSNLWKENGFFFLSLTDPFVDEHLRLMAAALAQGRRPHHSPLFNGHLDDAHFSPRGATLWGELVGRRLARLSDFRAAARPRRPRLDSSHASPPLPVAPAETVSWEADRP